MPSNLSIADPCNVGYFDESCQLVEAERDTCSEDEVAEGRNDILLDGYPALIVIKNRNLKDTQGIRECWG